MTANVCPVPPGAIVCATGSVHGIATRWKTDTSPNGHETAASAGTTGRPTREHHRGIFALFFRSEWEEVTGAKSLLGRYRQTLDGMFSKVWRWVRGR